MNDDISVVILAAGLGTRMRSAKAKVLHEAGGDTLLNQVIRAAMQLAPPDRLVSVVGHQAEEVRASVKTPGVRFAEQLEQKGTGHAVQCAAGVVPSKTGPLIVLNGDGPLLRAETLHALLTLFRSTNQGGAIVTTETQNPTGYGRIVADNEGHVAAIVEEKSATAEQRKIREINPGVYCFNGEHFWKNLAQLAPNNAAGEYYLTDMIGILREHGHPVSRLVVPDETELLGINTRIELAFADRVLRARKANELMLSGVTLEDPESITVDVDVQVGQDTVIEANVQLRGRTTIGANCRIGTGTVLSDCEVASRVAILPYVVANNSIIGSGAFIGPFARLRLNAVAGEDSHIGNFVELKNARLGRGVKANHLAYLGDAAVGAKTNIGAGTITCNYDGRLKHPTEIGPGVFVGSNSTLVAPLTLAEGSYIAAGSVITRNVEADALAIGRAHQVNKEGWAKRRRQKRAGES